MTYIVAGGRRGGGHGVSGAALDLCCPSRAWIPPSSKLPMAACVVRASRASLYHHPSHRTSTSLLFSSPRHLSITSVLFVHHPREH